MRTALLLAIVASAACYRAAPAHHDTYAVSPSHAIQAMTTDGDDILVQQDTRTGEFFIVSPVSMAGQPVAIVNLHDSPMLVTRDVRARRHVVGSGGDVVIHHDDNHR